MEVPPLTYGQQSAEASSEEKTGQNNAVEEKCSSAVEKNPTVESGIEPGAS